MFSLRLCCAKGPVGSALGLLLKQVVGGMERIPEVLLRGSKLKITSHHSMLKSTSFVPFLYCHSLVASFFCHSSIKEE